MATVQEVLRYLLERVPHRTQEDHDKIAALIEEQVSHGEQAAKPAPAKKEKTS